MKSSMRWRNSYSVMIESLTFAATPSAVPVSACRTAPGGGCGGNGVSGVAAAEGAVPAGGPVRLCASDGAAEAKRHPNRANFQCLFGKIRTFGSNLNGLRARPRTGRENKQKRPRFKDGRIHPAGTG